ncbi:MAG: prepilin-type N-terminal cleavage/methylation domain-containing protein [Betaproteobacteria bacterium]
MRRARGFSLLELVVVIVLIGVLLGVAIERLLVLKAQAERSAMETVLGSLRSGITIRMAELIAKGRAREIVNLVDANPVVVLAEAPENYLGELFGPDPAALEPGKWYFDTRDRTLCYLVESVEYFQSGAVGVPRARFRVQPVFEDVNRNGRFDRGTDTLRGLRLVAVERYAWHTQFTWPAWPWSAPAPAR